MCDCFSDVCDNGRSTKSMRCPGKSVPMEFIFFCLERATSMLSTWSRSRRWLSKTRFSPARDLSTGQRITNMALISRDIPRVDHANSVCRMRIEVDKCIVHLLINAVHRPSRYRHHAVKITSSIDEHGIRDRLIPLSDRILHRVHFGTYLASKIPWIHIPFQNITRRAMVPIPDEKQKFSVISVTVETLAPTGY